MTTKLMIVRSEGHPALDGVHSHKRLGIAEPELYEAKSFRAAFGMDMQPEGRHLTMYNVGHTYRWASILPTPWSKTLRYVDFAYFSEDFEQIYPRIQSCRLAERLPRSLPHARRLRKW